MKLKNRKINRKIMMRNMIILLFIIFGVMFFNNTSLSHTDVKHKTIYACSGDTLWSIAKNEQKKNEYYYNKDIRDIIDEIKQINGLKDSKILNNQKLEIPTIN